MDRPLLTDVYTHQKKHPVNTAGFVKQLNLRMSNSCGDFLGEIDA